MSFLSVFSLILFKLVAADEPICCIPAELEGHALVGQGSIFAMANGIDTYVNGSAHFAISMDLKKTYLRYKGVVLNSLFPKGKHIHMISLGDFSEGVEYEVANGNCSINKLDTNMTRRCIPAGTEMLSSGRLADAGANMSVSTYRIKPDEKPPESDQIIVTVNIRKEGPESICYPVQMTTYDSYFLDKYDYEFGLQSVEVFDIGPIHSTDIFKVPKQCMGAPMKEMKNKTALRFLI